MLLSEVSGITDIDHFGRKTMGKGFGLLAQDTEGAGTGKLLVTTVL